MKRFILKNPKLKLLKKRFVKRNKFIQVYMVNKNFYTLNGRFIFRMYIKKEMVGFKMGEFIYTRKKGSTILEKQKGKVKGDKKVVSNKVKSKR